MWESALSLRVSVARTLAVVLVIVVGSIAAVQAARVRSSEGSWSGTVYIRIDGSVDPSDAPIQKEGDLYILSGNIIGGTAGGIVLQRNNTMIDGAGYALQGANYNGIGIHLSGIMNATVRNVTVTGFLTGMLVEHCANNTIRESNVTANAYEGIKLATSTNHTLFENTVTGNDLGISLIDFSNDNSLVSNDVDANERGIELHDSMNNSMLQNHVENVWFDIRLLRSNSNAVCGNEIRYSADGIWLDTSSANLIYHNLCIGLAALSFPVNYTNSWDAGYPSGGNFWSTYEGADLQSGHYQNESGSDGIGDNPYSVNVYNADNFPLMGAFHDFKMVAQGPSVHNLEVVSNSTIRDAEIATWLTSPNQYLQPGQEFIILLTEGENSTLGFCRLTIPRDLLDGSYTVLVDWTVVQANELSISNSTHAYIYFTYHHSTHQIIVLPEFPSLLITSLSLMATALLALVFKKHARTLKPK
jgi:parallel beta-helix repeat protein